MISNRVIVRLLAGAIGLPIVLAVLFLVMQLFRSLHDPEGAHFLHQCGTIILLVWGADLVALLIVTALRSIQTDEIASNRSSETKGPNEKKDESVDWSQEMRKWQNEMKSWEKKDTETRGAGDAEKE